MECIYQQKELRSTEERLIIYGSTQWRCWQCWLRCDGWKNLDKRICSDSSSVLASFRSFQSKSRQDILYEVLQSVTRISNQGGQVKFLWVPAHVGVRGNERVDEMAKRTLRKENTEMHICISKAEVKSLIWENKSNMARMVGQSHQRHQGGYRREEIVMTRLRLGHCVLNKTLNMKGKHQSGLCG